jgi:hypothetical protein
MTPNRHTLIKRIGHEGPTFVSVGPFQTPISSPAYVLKLLISSASQLRPRVANKRSEQDRSPTHQKPTPRLVLDAWKSKTCPLAALQPSRRRQFARGCVPIGLPSATRCTPTFFSPHTVYVRFLGAVAPGGRRDLKLSVHALEKRSSNVRLFVCLPWPNALGAKL